MHTAKTLLNPVFIILFTKVPNGEVHTSSVTNFASDWHKSFKKCSVKLALHYEEGLRVQAWWMSTLL